MPANLRADEAKEREKEGEVIMPNTTYILLIALLPLAAFVLLGLFGRKHFNPSSGIIATALMSVSALLSFYTAYGYFFKYVR